MKDYALELSAKKSGYDAKLNIMREYIQAYALRIMHDAGVFRSTAFLGGAALRFLYELPRYSEDLDFSIAKPTEIAFSELMKKLKQEYAQAGYTVAVTYKEAKTVQSAFIKFSGLLYEAGISPLKRQNFSIKIEIDTNPPQGAGLETRLVNKYFPVSFLSYDLPSLFAGKIHALLSRKFTKGRDFFDLGWYLSRWKGLAPNFVLLENALKQTGWEGEIPREGNWRGFLSNVARQADWKKVTQDVERFLENPQDLNVMTQENILRLLE